MEILLKKANAALLNPRSPGWDAGTDRILMSLKGRRDPNKPPRPNMIWSVKHQLWMDPDNRTAEQKARDEKIAADVDRQMMTAKMDEVVERRATEFIRWWLDPKRKPAITNWTAGWERQIGYLMEFSAGNKSLGKKKR